MDVGAEIGTSVALVVVTVATSKFASVHLHDAAPALTLVFRNPTVRDTRRPRRTLDVTLWGAFHSAQVSARQMAEQGDGGSICFVSSVLAHIPMPTSLPYNTAKAGINHMSATIAKELTEHRIRSNVIEPGWIDTPGERQYTTDEEMREGAKKVPWKRLGEPEEIARMAAYLSSDVADYITGSVFRVDGGFSLQ